MSTRPGSDSHRTPEEAVGQVTEPVGDVVVEPVGTGPEVVDRLEAVDVALDHHPRPPADLHQLPPGAPARTRSPGGCSRLRSTSPAAGSAQYSWSAHRNPPVGVQAAIDAQAVAGVRRGGHERVELHGVADRPRHEHDQPARAPAATVRRATARHPPEPAGHHERGDRQADQHPHRERPDHRRHGQQRTEGQQPRSGWGRPARQSWSSATASAAMVKKRNAVSTWSDDTWYTRFGQTGQHGGGHEAGLRAEQPPAHHERELERWRPTSPRARPGDQHEVVGEGVCSGDEEQGGEQGGVADRVVGRRLAGEVVDVAPPSAISRP